VPGSRPGVSIDAPAHAVGADGDLLGLPFEEVVATVHIDFVIMVLRDEPVEAHVRRFLHLLSNVVSELVITKLDLALAARQQISTGSLHLGCECKLLAVENKHASMFVLLALGGTALILQLLHADISIVILVLCPFLQVQVVVGELSALHYPLPLDADQVAQFVEAFVNKDDVGLFGLERDHDVRLGPDSHLVRLLIEDRVPFVELDQSRHVGGQVRCHARVDRTRDLHSVLEATVADARLVGHEDALPVRSLRNEDFGHVDAVGED